MSAYPYACEGSCEKHSGNVRRVRVVGPTGYDWGFFHYCDNAVLEDQGKDFVVHDAPARDDE